MTTGLEVKTIEFNGDTIQTTQNIDGCIYVGASLVCDNVGLTKGQKQRQITNLQKDEVLKKGCCKFAIGVFDQNNETLGINIDYLPLWLAKIRITPKMKQDNPALATKLVNYQLNVKDVLSNIYIHKENPQSQNSMTQSDLVTAIMDMSKILCDFIQSNTKTKRYSSPMFPAWLSKVKPKIDEIRTYYYPDDAKYTRTYSLLFSEFSNTYDKDYLSQIVDDFCFNNGYEQAYTMDVVSHNEEARTLMETVIDNLLDTTIDNEEEIIKEESA